MIPTTQLLLLAALNMNPVPELDEEYVIPLNNSEHVVQAIKILAEVNYREILNHTDKAVSIKKCTDVFKLIKTLHLTHVRIYENINKVENTMISCTIDYNKTRSNFTLVKI